MGSRKFPMIRIIALALRIVAVLEIVSVVMLIVGVLSRPEVKQLGNQPLIAAATIVVVGYSMIFAIALFALAELLTCFTAIEENTRQGKVAVINLQSVVRTAIEEQTQALAQRLATQSAAQAATGVCPKCGARFRVTDSLRGQQAACPKCGAMFTI